MNYRKEMLRTLVGFEDRKTLTHAALGISGEVGETLDVLKKHLVHGKPLDREHLLEELGDVRWYMELMLELVGSSIEEIEIKNIEKLKKRYPEGFKE